MKNFVKVCSVSSETHLNLASAAGKFLGTLLAPPSPCFSFAGSSKGTVIPVRDVPYNLFLVKLKFSFCCVRVCMRVAPYTSPGTANVMRSFYVHYGVNISHLPQIFAYRFVVLSIFKNFLIEIDQTQKN